MTRILCLRRAGLATLTLLILVPVLVSQQPVRSQSIFLRVFLPADAVLEVEGEKTSQTGTERLFVSPPLEGGKKYTYNLKATWKDQGRDVTRSETVRVEPGQEYKIDFRSATAAADTKEPKEPKEPSRPPVLDVPYVPTPQEVVDEMLKLGRVGKDDVVFDLGCGDGRIVVTAAKVHGARGIGIDLNPVRVKESLENVKKAKVEKLVEIREGNVLKPIGGLEEASVVTLYLLPDVNLKLRDTLQKTLKPGSRIVSHDFDMGDWKPLKTVDLTDKSGREHTVYLWEVGKGEEPSKDKTPDVIYVPTPQAVVDKMLEMAEVKKTDVVYDLGCGDGRIVVTAAKKFGVKATGFDVDPQRIKESNENVKKNKVEELVKIEQKDIFTLDLSKANVITLYLLPELNVKLIPQLEKLKPGSRIVSHDFSMRGVKPKQVFRMKAKDDDGAESDHIIYLWVTPLEKEKDE